MACEGPTVVQGPPHLHFRVLFNPVKQHLYVDIVPVQVVQPEQVWLVRLCPFQKFPGRVFGAKPVRVEQTGLYRVHPAVEIRPDADRIFLELRRHRRLSPICNFDLVTLRLKLLCKVGAYSARAADTADGIYKQHLHLF